MASKEHDIDKSIAAVEISTDIDGGKLFATAPNGNVLGETTYT